VELDVSSGQEAGGNDGGGADTVFLKFQAKPVWPVGTRAGLPAIVGPSSKVDGAKEVGIGGTADVAILRRIPAAVNTRVKIAGDLGAADVESGEQSGRVMVHKVKMAEESAILAAGHKAEVRVVAAVSDNETAARGEVARNGKDVGSNRCGSYTHHYHQECARQQCGHQHRYNCFYFSVHDFSLCCAEARP